MMQWHAGSPIEAQTVKSEMVLRIGIADDHRIIRVGLRAIIDEQKDMEVVGEADTAHGALELITREQPDVAIIDVSLPDDSGLSILPTIAKLSPATRVLVLTGHVEPEIARRSLSAGIHGYLNKAADSLDVVHAVRMIAAGHSFFSVPLDGVRLGEFLALQTVSTQVSSAPPSTAANARPMSDRERQVLALFAQGLTHRQIADRLGVRVKTVETYRSRLGDRFGVRSREELVRCALDLGLVTTPT
jgi:two-component system, NarL family, response regulator NreC